MRDGADRAEAPGPRIGLFGGTFDPPHVGHLVVARDALEALGLDELRFVVAARSPFKEDEPTTGGELRAAMVDAALEGEEKMRTSRIELDRGGTSWTVETLRALAHDEPGSDWFLILGADQFAHFGSWREPEEIARRARVIVLARAGTGPDAVRPEVDVPFETIEVTRLDISSTEVRERVARRRSVRWLVPDAVRAILHDRRLYVEARADADASAGR